MLKRFGSLTVLNGHIHQLMQKTEGNVTFYTARSTAFPQPEPGTAPAPLPLVVPAEKLRSVLGTRILHPGPKTARRHRDAAGGGLSQRRHVKIFLCISRTSTVSLVPSPSPLPRGRF